MASMTKLTHNGIDNDVEIVGVGPYFRPVGGNRWRVDLKLSPKQAKDSFSASNASSAVRGRIINPAVKDSKRGWEHSFRISNTASWTVKTIGECPVNRLEKWTNPHQFCFVFILSSGLTIYLPQFELARILFFHGNYLSRTAIESECLKGEFSVEIDEEDNVLISVMESSGFTLAHLNEPKSRNYLSWILLDVDVRKSFESITRYQRMNGIDFKNYRRWNFQFDPPPLKGVELHVRGQYSREHNTCFVFEIVKVKRIPNQVHKSIGIWHPKFEHFVPGQGTTAQLAGGDGEAPLTVCDDTESNANIQPITVEAEAVSMEFQNPFYVSKVTTKERKRAASDSYEDGGDGLVFVSTEEGVQGYGLPGGDLDILDDETDYSEIYASKFKCFSKMVQMLIEEHGCFLISNEIIELRKVGKSKKHLLADGSARTLADVALSVQGKTFHLLEVDTSDAESSVSTQILLPNDPKSWKHDIETVAIELVRSSLRWPKKQLDIIFGENGHRGVHHPKAPEGNKGVLAADSVAGWAARIYGWITRL
jgi:hypothetical protein